MALIFYLKVVPSSGHQRWVLTKAGELKVYLKSPPEKGLANKELIKLFATTLKIPQEAVQILVGDTARRKKIKIDKELTFEQLLLKLDLALPEKQTLLW